MTWVQAEQRRASVAEGDPLPPHDLPALERPPSIEQVYRAQRPRLLRFLSRRAAEDVADDLVQQSFVRVLANQTESGPQIRRLDSYLFRVARNIEIDLRKAEQRHRRAEHALLEDVEESAPDQIPSADQVAALEARDMLQRLEAVMQRMKPRTREIFLAHRIDGYTYGEIAARTGLSVKGVEKHMSRAIATIDRSLRHR